MMGSCRAADGSDNGFIHLISKGATNGNSFTPSPAARRRLQLDTTACVGFDLYIYIVANTLPASRIISQCPPFEVQVTISNGVNEVYAKSHTVNQWGGSTIYIEFPKE
jgi:hypothetical protein